MPRYWFLRCKGKKNFLLVQIFEGFFIFFIYWRENITKNEKGDKRTATCSGEDVARIVNAEIDAGITGEEGPKEEEPD